MVYFRLFIIALVACWPLGAYSQSSVDAFNAAAISLTRDLVRYDGSYFKLPYPGGDVPAHLGVCTDVVIRAYRKVGIDLQQLVHEDMQAHFSVYPSRRIWGLTKPDRNIDHRRVPNLQVFFERFGTRLKITDDAKDYAAGELVTWMLPGNLPHIGLLVPNPNGSRPLVVHNIGRGQVIEDMLFDFKITGHYRYLP